MIEFIDDDTGYMAWLAANPEGFVVNVHTNPRPSYVVLHRAACPSISRPRDDHAYTGRSYRKAVSSELVDLRDFARTTGRLDGTFSQACSHCAPLPAAPTSHAP